MSELSQRDKDILLGHGRARDERIEALQDGANTPGKRLTACETRKMSSVFVVLTGILLIVGGWVLNGSHIGFEKGLGVALVVVGALWYLYLRSAIGKLRAAGVQPE